MTTDLTPERVREMLALCENLTAARLELDDAHERSRGMRDDTMNIDSAADAVLEAESAVAEIDPEAIASLCRAWLDMKGEKP